MRMEKVKKFFATLLAVIMVSSYAGIFANVSRAAMDLTRWHDNVYSYTSMVAYPMWNAKQKKMNISQKWLFYNWSKDYENLNCIRSGAGQDTEYTEYDLYHLKEVNPEVYNELFINGGIDLQGDGTNEYTNISADRKYQHILWEIENFYLFSAKDDADEAHKQAKLNAYNNFIGVSSLPYSTNNTITNKLYNIGVTTPNGKTFTTTKNEQLIKVLQNEMLLPFVKQTYERRVDTSTLYETSISGYKTTYTKASNEVQSYAQSVINKFTKLENSENYNPENINKYFMSGAANVTITSNSANSDALNNVSGSFYVKNPFNANISAIRVLIGNTEVTDYKVLDSNGNEVSNILNTLSNSASQNNYEFKIQAAGIDAGNTTVKVELDVDYGEIIEATLLAPKDANVKPQADGTIKGNQFLININKHHETATVSSANEAKAPEFDLALTKQITSVKKQDATESLPYNRLFYITTNGLQERKETDAKYIMQKTKVAVEPGSIVEYKITIYNEGQIDGFAEEITDYLPEGLTMVEPEYDNNGNPANINAQYGWEDNGDGTISTTYLSSNRNENSTNILKAFSGEINQENSKEIHLECVVSANVENGTVLDNRSEISKYGYYADENADGVKEFVEANVTGKDFDSKQDSVLQDANSNNIISNLIAKIENIINDKSGFSIFKDDKNDISYEDDDDIERLIVKQDISKLDLALRKWIIDVDGTEYEREPEQLEIYKDPTAVTAMEVYQNEGLNYIHPKDAIKLQKGSIVTYRIGLFNEGTKDGYAEEVTDYLPQGLEFVEDNEINASYGWTATKNADGTTTVKTNILSKDNGEIIVNNRNSNMLSTLLHTFGDNMVGLEGRHAYTTIDIVCKVSDDFTESKYLTNRAEITKYGYYTNSNEFIEANEKDIDIDSEEDTIKNDLNLDDWYKINYLDIYNANTPNLSFPGVQDDDDFETVYVEVVVEEPENTDYSIQIKKVSEEDKTKTIEGAKFSIKNTQSKAEKESEPTNDKGITTMLEKVVVDNTVADSYEIKETYVPEFYKLYGNTIKLTVGKKLVNNKYVIDLANTKVEGENVELSVDGTLITITVPNKEKEFDLSLRKFITAINGSELDGENSREPQVDLSTLINGDEAKNGEKTATYTHTKEALLVNPTDIVEYTIRIYNEGELDGYASRIIDDVPEGVTMVAPEYDSEGKAVNKNAEYRWIMYKEMNEEDENSQNSASKTVLRYNGKFYVETDKAEEAVLISTDYLSKENGEAKMSEEDKENPNLISAFTGSELSSKDIKVEFKVKQTKDTEKIITNYAQISSHQYSDGTSATDRDSTPNEWIKDEDDQDIENIRVTWFDLALYKWVSSTIVTEDGKTKEYASGHTQDNKDAIVNVTLAKDKLDKTSVKFKWTIKVENQGVIAGYATELKDHIPAGLKFVEEDNKEYGWKLQEDGTITTDYLKNTLLQPKDTAEVIVILTWVNSSENLGVKVNSAEISEDFNAYDTPDIDSTPDNFKGKPAEDDEDQDEVRLNVRTGSGIIMEYVLIVTACLAIISTGVVLIKKNVLDKEF